MGQLTIQEIRDFEARFDTLTDTEQRLFTAYRTLEQYHGELGLERNEIARRLESALLDKGIIE